MGFEYKIRVALAGKQLLDIQKIVESSPFFDVSYEYNGRVHWDLRNLGNSGKMPNTSVVFEDDGIYVLQNTAPFLWTNLAQLKSYLKAQNINFLAIDYQE